MGSFNVTCHLTNNIIEFGDEVVVIPMTQNRSTNSIAVDTWEYWSPIPIMLEGKYNSGGGISDVALFQSQETISPENTKVVYEGLEQFFQENTRNKYAESDKPPMEEMVGHGWTYLRPNMDISLIKSILKLSETIKEHPESGIIDMSVQQLKMFGYNSVEEAKQYVSNNEGKVQEEPLAVVFMQKSALVQLLNQYGVDSQDEDHYATVLQQARAGLKESVSQVQFMTGKGNYAGANNPKFDLATVGQEIDSPNKSAFNQVNKMHCLDTLLLNDYMSLLGKGWQPTVTVSESAKEYGHHEALEMQKVLLNPPVPRKKMKK